MISTVRITTMAVTIHKQQDHDKDYVKDNKDHDKYNNDHYKNNTKTKTTKTVIWITTWTMMSTVIRITIWITT